MEAIKRGRRFATHDVWHVGRPGEEIPHGFIIKQVRVGILLIQSLIQDALLLRASALTFATILAIVPFLTVTFFFIQTFQIDKHIYARISMLMEQHTSPSENNVEEGNSQSDEHQDFKQQFVNSILQGVAQKDTTKNGDDLTNPVHKIVEYAQQGADKLNVGSAALLFVIATVFGLMMNIESSFNTIWGLKRSRSWYRVFSNYLAVLLLLPFLVAIALGVAAALETQSVNDQLGLFAFVLLIIQYGIIWLAFTAMYFVIPNTQVKLRYALLGGIIAGTMWSLVAKGYVHFQFGLNRYSFLYSTFAQVPVLLMWVYVSWVILLFGAELTFAYQNEKTFAMERLCKGASYAYREALALRTMIEIGRHFEEGLPGLTIQDASAQWNVPTRLLNDMLESLENAKLVTACATEPVTYVPARPPEKMTVGDVITAIRESGQEPSLLREDETCSPLFTNLGSMTRAFNSTTMIELSMRISPEELPENTESDTPSVTLPESTE